MQYADAVCILQYREVYSLSQMFQMFIHCYIYRTTHVAIKNKKHQKQQQPFDFKCIFSPLFLGTYIFLIKRVEKSVTLKYTYTEDKK